MNKAVNIILKTRYGDIVTLTYDYTEHAWVMDCSNVAYTIKSGTNVINVKNNDSSNTLVICAIILYGESPVLV